MRSTGAWVITVAAVLLLGGCSAHAESAEETEHTAASTPTPSPSAKPVTLPTDCTRVVAADVYAKELAPTPLNDPAVIAADRAGAVTPMTPRSGATFSQKLTAEVGLRCVWRDPADAGSGLTLTMAHADLDSATSYLSRAKLLHFACADVHHGRECQRAEQHGKSSAVTLHSVFLRNDVFIDVTQTDFITDDIVGSIVAALWP